MSLHIGDIAPDFSVSTTTGPISLHDWGGRFLGVLLQPPG
jgi:peroxiredoxin (alkyl hydroperoxide reductase subunit C)